MTDKEKKVIEVLRLYVCSATTEPIQHKSYPEESGVGRDERPCDATWQGPRDAYAIEHTTVDSFMGQRHDDDRFQRLMGSLEKEWSGFPDDWLQISMDVAAIPNGVSWSDLSSQIKAWLIDNISSLPFDCESPIRIPDVPFELRIFREKVPGGGRVLVARHSPADLSDQRVGVIRRALDKKLGVLQQYKSKGYSTILLIESSDFALSSRNTIFMALRDAYQSETDRPVFDQIYIATTGTAPWCIVPFKLGPEIMKEPKPYWPTAPGYPSGAN